MNRAFARHLLWLAMVIALCNALLPTALRIVASARGEQVVTICSSFGIKQIQIDAETGQPASGQQAAGSCEYCLASQLACLPSLDHPAPAPIVQVSAVLPDRFRVQFDGTYHWPSAQPRAPPTFS